MAETNPTYDYIIVGAGSAGCALAYRLSREASRRVLLLEAGGKDSFPLIHIPLGFAFLMKNPKVNWCYETEPEPNMHHRRISWPRGKVLGGTSCINGMVYIRGQREDYDHWQRTGQRTAGPTMKYCPTSSARSTRPKAPTTGTATAAHCG